jgi:hypothetical protein
MSVCGCVSAGLIDCWCHNYQTHAYRILHVHTQQGADLTKNVCSDISVFDSSSFNSKSRVPDGSSADGFQTLVICCSVAKEGSPLE